MFKSKVSRAVLIAIEAILAVLTLAAVIKTVFVSFDIDEAYAIAQSYRLCEGDLLFKDMWEPHQMSAFFAVPFEWVFLLLSGGSTTGMVIFLRIIGSIIHLALGVWIYFAFRERTGHHAALLASLAHVNFLPKQIVMPEFEIMQYWAVLVVFIALWRYLEKTKSGRVIPRKFLRAEKQDLYLCIAGAALFVAMMTYPTMVLLYPVYVLALCVLVKGSAKEKFRAVLIFTSVTFVIGVIFLIILFVTMTPGEFVENVRFIFMDDSHASSSFGVRMKSYLSELANLSKLCAKRIPIAAVVAGAVTLLCKLIPGKRNSGKSKAALTELFFMTLVISLLEILVIHQFRGQILEDKNQFFMYFRFLLIPAFGCGLAVYTYERNVRNIYLGIIPAFVGAAASALVTNMSFEIACARCFIGVIATIICLGIYLKSECEDRIIAVFSEAFTVSVILSLILCKLVMIRVTGCMPLTVLADMEKVTDGPLKGIYVVKDDADMYNDNFATLSEYIEENENVLYFSAENIYYLINSAKCATPSVQGTAVFNEMYSYYYERHPDKFPETVVIDKAYETNFVYNYSPQNSIFLEVIEEKFTDAPVYEDDRLVILTNHRIE